MHVLSFQTARQRPAWPSSSCRGQVANGRWNSVTLIFKEAINNAITHSECTEINLNANVSGKFLTMLLKDNGRGFDPQLESHGNGVKNMMNRSKKIGGKFTINSEIGIGTVIKYIGHIH